ncbi:MAG: metallophosphoesterase family protein [Chitinophagales bacterium]
MKKILLISDNHSYIETKLNPYMEEADEIWHAGDIGNMDTVDWMQGFGKTLRAVYGNIDDKKIRDLFPEDNLFQVESTKVWMTHIGGYPGRYTSRVKALFPVIEPMLFVCGHSHIVRLEQDKKYNHWIFNPGAFGNVGFHQVKTAIRFTIEENNIRNVEVINLGHR